MSVVKNLRLVQLINHVNNDLNILWIHRMHHSRWTAQ